MTIRGAGIYGGKAPQPVDADALARECDRAERARYVYTTETPCPDCSCVPRAPQGCHCSFPGCPCREIEDEEED